MQWSIALALAPDQVLAALARELVSTAGAVDLVVGPPVGVRRAYDRGRNSSAVGARRGRGTADLCGLSVRVVLVDRVARIARDVRGVRETLQVPWVEVAETYLTPFVSLSVTTTFVAVSGPAFVTVIV